MNWNTSIKEVRERGDAGPKEYSYIEDDELEAEASFHPLSEALRLVPVAILCLIAAFFVWKNFFSSAPAVDISDSVIQERLQYVKDLVVLEYNYTNAGKYEGENASSFFGFPITGKFFIVTYDGVIKYRVNLGKMEVKTDTDNKIIRIKLPHSEISSHEIPEKSIQVLEERDGAFSDSSVSDFNAFLKQQKAVMEAKGEELGLPEKAERQCEETVQAFLETLPGVQDYQILIETK